MIWGVLFLIWMFMVNVWCRARGIVLDLFCLFNN